MPLCSKIVLQRIPIGLGKKEGRGYRGQLQGANFETNKVAVSWWW